MLPILENCFVDQKEISKYMNVLPKIEIYFNCKFGPQFFWVNNNVLVMEDLSQLGFHTANRIKLLD